MKTPKQLSIVVASLNYGIAYRGHSAFWWAGQDDRKCHDDDALTARLEYIHLRWRYWHRTLFALTAHTHTHAHRVNRNCRRRKAQKANFHWRIARSYLFLCSNTRAFAFRVPTRQEILPSKEQLVNAFAMTKRKFPVLFFFFFCMHFLCLFRFSLFLVPSARTTSNTIWETLGHRDAIEIKVKRQKTK